MDSGASHNFIAREVVTSLNLEVIITKDFSVGLRNGSKCSSNGVCRNLHVKLGPYTIVLNAFVWELGGMDLILGVEWRATHGRTTLD